MSNLVSQLQNAPQKLVVTNPTMDRYSTMSTVNESGMSADGDEPKKTTPSPLRVVPPPPASTPEWVEHYSEDYKRPYCMNTKTQQSTWVEPEVLTAAAPAPAQPPALPTVWVECFSDEHKREYWTHRTTGESTWVQPGDGGGGSGGAASLAEKRDTSGGVHPSQARVNVVVPVRAPAPAPALPTVCAEVPCEMPAPCNKPPDAPPAALSLGPGTNGIRRFELTDDMADKSSTSILRRQEQRGEARRKKKSSARADRVSGKQSNRESFFGRSKASGVDASVSLMKDERVSEARHALERMASVGQLDDYIDDAAKTKIRKEAKNKNSSVQVDYEMIEGGEGQLLKYDEWSVVQCGGLTVCTGTTFTSSPFIWYQLLFFLLFAAATGAILSRYDADPLMLEHGGDILTEMFGAVMFPLSFLIGLCVSATLARWWTLRDNCIGGLWGCTDDLCLHSGSIFSGLKPESRKHDLEFKARLLRLGLASFALLFMQARAELDAPHSRVTVEDASDDNNEVNGGSMAHGASPKDMEELVKRGLLTGSEARLLSNHHSEPQVIWCWINQMFHTAAEEGRLGDHQLWYLSSRCAEARGTIGRTFAYLDTQLPMAYVHLLALMVKVALLMMAFSTGLSIAAFSIVPSNASPDKGTNMAARIFELIIWSLFLQGMLGVQAALANPLGRDKIDFPARNFHKAMRNEALSFLLSGEEFERDNRRRAAAGNRER